MGTGQQPTPQANSSGKQTAQICTTILFYFILFYFFCEVLGSGAVAFRTEVEALGWLRGSPLTQRLPGAIVLRVATAF